ncbi:Cna B-type domain-containing protein [Bulleidia extructa]|uniref:Cna B-type domain-containing protein n=1 Tax=Bulleidia extructa TaxID=118748 RepID=UPI002356C62C|nr:Cna B-type domain-containing protein [Bulleidia extructa]
MKKRGILQKTFLFFLIIFVMFLSVSISNKFVFAESKEVSVTIKNFTITDSTGVVPPNGFTENTLFKLNYEWDALSHENKLHEGDYFEFDLPDQFKFPKGSYCNFDLYAPNGEVMAKVVITPKEPGGGKIKVTFTSYVENKYGIAGDMHLIATWNKTTYPVTQEGEYDIAIGSFHTKIKVKPDNPIQPENEVFNKTSGQTLTEEGNVRWRLRINKKKANLNNVVITDKLEVEDPGSPEGIEYITNSFVLWELKYENGKWIEKKLNNVSNKVVLSPDKRTFTYSMGDINGKTYMLRYQSTYREGLKLKNTAKLQSTQTVKIVKNQFINAESGGGGQGNLTSKIKIVKIDKDNEKIKLKNAKFKITRKETGKSFELTTNANGEAVSMQLIPGEYTIKELESPTHYLLDNTEYTVTVTSDKVAIQTIKNEPEKTSISVKKQWVGKEGSAIMAVLKADGVEVARKELSSSNNWKHTFENLRKYKPVTDEEIVYKVEEETVPSGYKVEYEIDSQGNQIIKNILNKTSVKVTKVWEDKNDQDGKRPDSVTIKLFADGKETGKTLILKKANNWTGSFIDLDEYKDGKKIVYTIKEETVGNGYITEIIGEAEKGFKVINTRQTEKTSVSVEKKWVGPAKNEVEVELLADGKATNQKITLNQGTNWKGEFKDLYKYDKDDGHEIEYRVKEKKISGYETVISGTAKSGYTITNTIAGKVSIAVRKEWVGKEGSSATIRLIANGKEILSTTLDSAHNWRHTFAGLEKYKDGVEIKYEIKEDAIANYESEITGNVANGFVVKNTNTEKVSVRVEKKWNGPKQTSVKVNLMADGVVQKQIELNEGGSWKGEFKELAKYAPDGHEIEYTVKEETPMNYESKITGNQQSGYTITNTNIEKVSVSVEKKWIGKEGALAKVELLADGVVKERVTLSKATNDWKYRFTNLAKYASDGHEIEYTVREEKVEGYETAISGTAKSGYTITNRITGKVTIAVRKKWIGKEGNRVVVNLYANGKKVGSQALTKDKDWQYTFTNLEKYENGQEIEYTVKEEKVEGYTTKIEGDMKSGYTIINKENSKKAKTPRTSDDHQGMMYGGLLMSSIMSMLGIVIMKRREME